MTSRKRAPAGKAGARKPKVRKETIRDLDAKKGKPVKGGAWTIPSPTYGCATVGCATINCGVLIG
jgi:hypothetical protein